MKAVFHLAIPTHDLELAKGFYADALGSTMGRQYPSYAIFDFFGTQLVYHLDKTQMQRPRSMYPRHFGVLFSDKISFDLVYEKAKAHELDFFEDRFQRFAGKPEAHWSFFLVDPSNNLVEFKFYENVASVFS